MYTDTQKNEFISLRSQGHSFDKISEKLKIPIRTLFRWAKDNADAINMLKDAAFEALLESLKVNAGNRLRMLADDLNKINKRTNKTAFDYLSERELLSFKIKIIEELSKFDTNIKSDEVDNKFTPEPGDDNPDDHIDKIINSKNKDLRKNPLILDRIKVEKQINKDLNLFNQNNSDD